jgi:hypothetical protein
MYVMYVIMDNVTDRLASTAKKKKKKCTVDPIAYLARDVSLFPPITSYMYAMAIYPSPVYFSVISLSRAGYLT